MMGLHAIVVESTLGCFIAIMVIALMPFILMILGGTIFKNEDTPQFRDFKQNYFIDEDRKPGT
ncbi:MAG: hypothetical protein CMM74_10300 [Rhodospirillaceae bacterium]|jgi:hypothetical protein|nr:hypothetical protein [Rhodospirillaceae bacterium]|tara:strand:+ start:390 stop:578 length:189 start_codon:yes stop_codon:yes gene_type:complete